MKKSIWLLYGALGGLALTTLTAKPTEKSSVIPEEASSLTKSMQTEDQEPPKTNNEATLEQPVTDAGQGEAKDQPTTQTSTPTQTKKSNNRTVIDKILVRVNGANILLSTLTEQRIAKEGKAFTIDEAIFDELLAQKATEMHMLPTAVEVERYITSFKMQNNLTDLSDKEFEDQLTQSGFTLKQYKQQIARMIAVENVKRAEISEKIVITAQEVEEYYHKHPQFTKESYHIQTSTQGDDKAEAWQDLGWIGKKDLSKQFECVLTMQPGAISEPIANDEGQQQRIKLVEKKEAHRKTLDEQYGAIERKLQNAKKKNFLGELEKELKEKATIVYL